MKSDATNLIILLHLYDNGKMPNTVEMEDFMGTTQPIREKKRTTEIFGLLSEGASCTEKRGTDCPRTTHRPAHQRYSYAALERCL